MASAIKRILFVRAESLRAHSRIIIPAAPLTDQILLRPGEKGRNQITKLPGELRGKKHEIAGRKRRIDTRNERNNRPMCPLEIKGPTQRSFQLLDINLVDEECKDRGVKQGYQPPDQRRRSVCRYDKNKRKRCRRSNARRTYEYRKRKEKDSRGLNWTRSRNHSVPPELRDALVIDVPIRRTHLLNCHDYQQRRRRRSPL